MSLSLRGKRRGLHVRLTTLVVGVCTMVAMLALMAQAASAFVPCPSGETRAGNISEWETLWGTSRETAKGVTMCLGEEGIWGTDKGYLQIVDLTDGAKIRLQSDPTALSGRENPDTAYRKKTAPNWYSWIRERRGEIISGERLFSTTNATFFKDAENETTTLPLPFLNYLYRETLGVSWRRAREYEREEGRRLDEDYEAPKKIFLLGNLYEGLRAQPARVASFPTHYPEPYAPEGSVYWEAIERADPSLPRSNTTLDAAVGFTPEYIVGEEERTPKRRNYLGVYGSIVYIFTSDAEYTNAEASAIMQEIQRGMEVIQLDGGGSAQLYSDYGRMDSSIPVFDRSVPNVIAIYRAP
jgi:hypothetical protein